MMNTQDALRARVVTGVPALACVYGLQGHGKSTDKLYAAPCGIHIAAEGGLKPAANVVGYIPPALVQLKPKEMILGRVREEVRKAHKRWPKADAVVLDELTSIMARTARIMEAKHKDGRQLHFKLAQGLGAAVDEWRSMGMHVLVDCWPRDPIYDEVTKLCERPGTPDMAGKGVSRAFVGMTDLTVRIEPDPMERGWPVSYRCGLWEGQTDWLTRDRHHVCRSRNPVNIGEILRAAGYTLRRPPGWEWHEEWVEWGAQAIVAGHPESTVFQQLAQFATENGKAGTGAHAAVWMARDIRARARIRRQVDPAARLRDMGIMV